MPFLGSKYAKIAFADPAGGAYSAPPDPLAGLKGPTSKGREGTGMGGERGKGGVGKGRGNLGEARERDQTHSRPPNPYFWIRPWLLVHIVNQKKCWESFNSKNRALTENTTLEVMENVHIIS